MEGGSTRTTSIRAPGVLGSRSSPRRLGTRRAPGAPRLRTPVGNRPSDLWTRFGPIFPQETTYSSTARVPTPRVRMGLLDRDRLLVHHWIGHADLRDRCHRKVRADTRNGLPPYPSPSCSGSDARTGQSVRTGCHLLACVVPWLDRAARPPVVSSGRQTTVPARQSRRFDRCQRRLVTICSSRILPKGSVALSDFRPEATKEGRLDPRRGAEMSLDEDLTGELKVSLRIPNRHPRGCM